MLFNNNKKKIKENKKPNFWISYADILAGLLLMFILILTVIIFDYKDVLSYKQDTVDRMLGIRMEIINALQEEFADTELSLDIDSQTGAIRFPGKIFFDLDSVEISEEGSNDLGIFIPRYIDILLGENFRDYISQIIIEGHTDDIGSYMYNLELSQNRALAVIKEIYKDSFPNFKQKSELKNYLTANGRSFSQTISDKYGNIDRERSRRVEFQFRLKDEQMIKELQEILKG